MERLERESLSYLLLNDGKTQQEIAEFIGRSKNKVCYWRDLGYIILQHFLQYCAIGNGEVLPTFVTQIRFSFKEVISKSILMFSMEHLF